MEKVAYLSLPEHLDPSARHVRVMQTHHAWIFMTGRYVYKLKKPVRDDRIDYSTLSKRHWACSEELRLNRRLAADTYYDVVPLRRKPDGGLSLSGEGEVDDWLVKMRELPRARMLDVLIRNRALREQDIDRVVERLVLFYRAAPALRLPPGGYAARLRADAGRLVRDMTTLEVAWLPASAAEALAAATARHEPALEQRGLDGYVREVHGDLRPEHVCLTDTVQIFDCLEFDAGLRTMDCLEEMSFLGLECARAGDDRLANALRRRYADGLPDPTATDELAQFYTARQALTRALLYARRSRASGDRWESVSRWYRTQAASVVGDAL